MDKEKDIKILLIEDDPDDVLLLKKFLEKAVWKPAEFNIHLEEHLQGAMDRLEKESFDIILLDLSLPDSQGVETLKNLTKKYPDLPIVVITGFDDEGLALESLRQGAQDYLIKGNVDSYSLPRTIHYSLERKRVEQKLKLAQEDLRNSEARYRLLFDSNPSMYFTLDNQGRVLAVNEFGAETLGYKPEELIGQSVLKVFLEKYHPQVEQNLQECLSEPAKIFEWELRNVCKDGRKIWVRELARAVKDARGQTVVLVVCDDITEQKNMDRMKNEFINTIYHEMQTPLESLYETTKDLEHGAMGLVSEKQAKILEIIGRNIQRLSRVTQDLHDLSMLELGKTKVRRQILPVFPLVKETVHSLEQAAEEWRVRIVLDFPERLPKIKCDSKLIKKVLNHLMINAMRFAREEVRVWGRSFEKDDFVEIGVHDDGPGQQSNEIRQFLENYEGNFGQEGSKKARLDLAICKEILELHNGKIWSQSKPGTGSSITLLLPSA